jgi:hypothetical protein
MTNPSHETGLGEWRNISNNKFFIHENLTWVYGEQMLTIELHAMLADTNNEPGRQIAQFWLAVRRAVGCDLPPA